MATTFPFPAAPVMGQQITLADGTTKLEWTGYSWEPPFIGVGKTTIDDIEPLAPAICDRWIKPSTSEEMVRVPISGGGMWVNFAAQSQLPLPLSVSQGGTGSTVEKYLPLAGGTVTGTLGVLNSIFKVERAAGQGDALIELNAPPGVSKGLIIESNGAARWKVLSHLTAEGGGNTGSQFVIERFNDAGVFQGAAFQINRNDGWATFLNNLTVNGSTTLAGFTSSGFTATGTCGVNGTLGVNSNIELGGSAPGLTPFIDFHSCTSQLTDYDGRIICGGGGAGGGSGTMNYQAGTHNFYGGVVSNTALTTWGNLVANNNVVIVTNSYPALLISEYGVGSKYIRVHANSLEVINNANTAVIATITDVGTLNMAGNISANGGYGTKAGVSAGVGGNLYNINWTGVGSLWIDSTYIGQFSFVSDERVKHRVEPMALLDEEAFTAIEPIRFHWADVGIFRDDGAAHWGFSAQNIARTLPEALTGDIEAVQENGDPQPASIDDRAILAQTVLQVQDLIRRIKALEKA